MKKSLSLFIVLLISIFVLASCSSIEGIVGNIGGILPGSGDNSGTHGKPSQDYKYTDFSDEEKAILSETLGAEIPFAPCRSYYFEGVNGDFSQGIRYYTVGSNRSEFNSYLALLEDYEHGLDSLIKAVKMYDKYQNTARDLGCFDDMTVILGWVDHKL